MKKAYIIHGWEGYPEEGWFPWLRAKLVQEGFQVVVPAMPDSAKPTQEKWLSCIQDLVTDMDANTYLVGHSLGCITILRFLESLKEGQTVDGAVLVGGFGQNLEYAGYNNELDSFFQKKIDWEKIKKHCRKFVAIHSDNDPFVPLKHNHIFVKKLAAESVIEHNKFHFSGDDGISELPSALEAVLKASNQKI